MILDTKQRTLAPEIMDDFEMEGSLLQQALEKIATINRLLGGNRITIQGVAALIRQLPAGQCVRIVDIGCGNGDMLRALADYARKHGWNLQLTGVDANKFTVRYATACSATYPEISYRWMDVMHDDFDTLPCDIILCTLTLHHFTDEQILQLMQHFRRKATVGIVVNDLHRCNMAYRLFQLVCFVFRLNRMTRADGLTSILRGFRKAELRHLSEKLQLIHYSLRWQWAFRYQWVISNL